MTTWQKSSIPMPELPKTDAGPGGAGAVRTGPVRVAGHGDQLAGAGTHPSASRRRPGIGSRPIVLAALLVALLALIALASLATGAVYLSPRQLLAVLVNPDQSSLAYRILFSIRLPRILATSLAGMALAVAGAILQTLLNNPLAGPNIIGVNAGAGFAATLILAWFPQYFSLIPLASFGGALLATLLIFSLAQRTGASRLTIILAGVALASFLGAATDTLLVLSSDKTLSVNTFMLGGFAGVTLARVSVALPAMLIAMLIALVLARSLSVLALGDEVAHSLGLHVRRQRLLWILLAAILAGGAVSFAGLLGFVGLIAPHAARFLLGPRPGRLLLVSGLLGAVFVTACDWLARLVFAPYELPVGIVMSFLGAPFFIGLLLKQRRGRRDV